MDRFFGMDKVSAHDENVSLLTTVHDDVECSIICGILEEDKIPFLVKDRGTGEVVRILFGYSMFDSDIFVPNDLLAQASELLDAYRNGEVCEETDGETEEE